MSILDRTWLEIDLDLLSENYKKCKAILASNKLKILAVVKADSYGLGAFEVSKKLIDDGVDMLAVATIDEALSLRRSGITSPILIFNLTSKDRYNELIDNDLMQSIGDMKQAFELSNIASKLDKVAKIHIEIDTGLIRTGFLWNDCIDEIEEIYKLKNIEIEGIYQNFSTVSKTEDDFMYIQIDRFNEVLQKLSLKNIDIPIKHVCNSAAAIGYPDICYDMVRFGISLYGFDPFNGKENSLDLHPIFTLKTRISRIIDLEKGVGVGYDRTYITNRKSRIATIDIGYGDGFTRLFSNKVNVLINGQYAPVVGKICMDTCMIDITDVIGDINERSEVVIYGQQGLYVLSPVDSAKIIGVAVHEVMCMISKRVIRYYIKNNKIYR